MYAIKHNRSIILTHWSYFKSDLFDIFDFSNYPVPVYPLKKFKSITYDAVEPEVSKDYLNCFLDKPNNMRNIADNLNLIPTTVFNKEREYPETTLLFHDSAGGGDDSLEFFKHIKFTPFMARFYGEKTLNYPSEYNALHIRNTDIKTNVEPLLQTISNNELPLFIGTDDISLKEHILKTYTNTFSSSFETKNDDNLHYVPDEYILEWAIVDLLSMVFSQNTIKSTYARAEVPIYSGFTRLIDLLKTIKSKIHKEISEIPKLS
jgi:hypothetical protein